MVIKEKDPLEWEEISTEHIVQDEWIDFRKSAYRFPDGIPAGNAHHGLANGEEKKI